MTSNHDVVLTPAASNDLRSILRYTKRKWSEDQRNRYAVLFESSFAELGRFPLIGTSRDDISQGIRMVSVGQHMLFYRIEDTMVVIVRILHSRMNAADVLNP